MLSTMVMNTDERGNSPYTHMHAHLNWTKIGSKQEAIRKKWMNGHSLWCTLSPLISQQVKGQEPRGRNLDPEWKFVLRTIYLPFPTSVFGNVLLVSACARKHRWSWNDANQEFVFASRRWVFVEPLSNFPLALTPGAGGSRVVQGFDSAWVQSAPCPCDPLWLLLTPGGKTSVTKCV